MFGVGTLGEGRLTRQFLKFQGQDLDDVKALEEYLTSQQRLQQQGNVWMFPVAEVWPGRE